MYNLIRFQQALKTPLGDLLIFLVITTLTLSFFYLFFWFRFKKNKDLIFRHHYLYKKVEKEVESGEYVGQAISDIFAKKQLIELNDGRFAQSMVSYPEVSTPDFIRCFYDYHSQLKQTSMPCFPDNLLEEHQGLLVNIEPQYTHQDGKSLISLSQYLLDKKLSLSEKELILMDLAHILEELHQLTSQDAQKLYHGLLLPRHIYLCQNMMKQITHIYISHHGYAYSLNNSVAYKWIDYVLDNKIYLEQGLKRDLQKFAFVFAPEQRESKSWEAVNSSCDFYSFAALALYLFTETEFQSANEVNWDLVPQDWRGFLKECLEVDPNLRPENFLELNEYFNTPELSLSNAEKEQIKINSKEALHEPRIPLKEIFENVHKLKSQFNDFSNEWQNGFSALKEQNFDQAFIVFNGIMKADSQAFNAHLGLALTFYQKGESEKAKFHYEKAKQLDSKRISCFHRLMTFDI